jgi:hypothetical protein
VSRYEKVYVYVSYGNYVSWPCGWSYRLQGEEKFPFRRDGKDNTASGGNYYTSHENSPRPGGKTAPWGAKRRW